MVVILPLRLWVAVQARFVTSPGLELRCAGSSGSSTVQLERITSDELPFTEHDGAVCLLRVMFLPHA